MATPLLVSQAEQKTVELLDGGAEAFPRMLAAIDTAKRTIHLEIYIFAWDDIGTRFITALSAASKRGVKVNVVLDGWGSSTSGNRVSATLRQAGCTVQVYNRLWTLFMGRFRRNHRKLLLVDDEFAVLGGINIADEYARTYETGGWADLAIVVRGPACVDVGRMLRKEPILNTDPEVRVMLSGVRGSRKLRQAYIKALREAEREVWMAQAYFIPDAGLVRAIVRAAKRGVAVRLLLAGRSDVLFVRSATMSLYARLLRAGVEIHEWTQSVLHAKAAVIDDKKLLVGSFNLDPLSMVNLETLVEVTIPSVAHKGREWIAGHAANGQLVVAADCRRTMWQRFLTDQVGLAMARLAQWVARLIGKT